MNKNEDFEFIGMIVEVAGVASIVAGMVLSFRHWPAGVTLCGGAAAYIIGKRLRLSASGPQA